MRTRGTRAFPITRVGCAGVTSNTEINKDYEKEINKLREVTLCLSPVIRW